MGTPSEPEPSTDAFKFVTVRDLQEFLRHISHQRIYRPKPDGDEEGAIEVNYINAVRRFLVVRNEDADLEDED